MTLGNTPRRNTVIRLEARKSFALGLAFLEAEDKTTPINLTGATVRLMVAQPSWLGGANVLNETATILSPATGGLAQFELQALDLDLDAGEYPYSVTLVTSLGYSTVLLKGVLAVEDNADTSTSGTYPSINPGTNLALYLESGVLVNVNVDTVFGLTPGVGAAHTGASSGVHGATGAVVGTTDTQTLTNKNLSSGTNTFPSSLATDAEVTTAVSDHAALTATHGATGAVVGTTNTQTLTNKTLTAPTITDPTVTLSGATVKEVVVDNTAPAHSEGRIWRDADDTWGRTYISDGAAWTCIGIDSYPEAHCTKSGNQSVNDTSMTTVNWGAASPNVGSMWPGSAGTLTVPIAGIYAICGQIQYAGTATGGCGAYLAINGSTVYGSGGSNFVNNQNNQKSVSLTKKLAANDTIELQAYHTNGSAIDVEPGTAPAISSLDVILVRPV